MITLDKETPERQPDREKVIEGLRRCIGFYGRRDACLQCPYRLKDPECLNEAMRDALILLKAEREDGIPRIPVKETR